MPRLYKLIVWAFLHKSIWGTVVVNKCKSKKKKKKKVNNPWLLVGKDEAKLASSVKSLQANTNALCGNEALIHNERRRNFYFKEKSSKTAVLKEFTQ